MRGHIAGVASVLALLSLAQALVDVIDGGLAGDEVVEVLLNQGLELARALLELPLQIVSSLLQVC